MSKDHLSGTCDRARRNLLGLALAAPLAWASQRAGATSPLATTLVPAAGAAQIRSLALTNTHTAEKLRLSYFTAGQYVGEALQRLDHVFRDHRSGEVHPIDRQLFDRLHQLSALAGCEPEYEIISGYRSPASNELLRSGSTGVAKKSLHMQGKAIDVRLRGVPCSRLRDLALQLQVGGVGYYPKSAFVHLDTGRVRSWSG